MYLLRAFTHQSPQKEGTSYLNTQYVFQGNLEMKQASSIQVEKNVLDNLWLQNDSRVWSKGQIKKGEERYITKWDWVKRRS